MSIFTSTFKNGASKGRVETQNLYFFEEDDFEPNDDFQFDSLCTALDTVAAQTDRSYPMLSSDSYSSLDGLI